MKLNYLHLSDLHFSYSNMRGDKWAVVAFDQSVATKSMLRTIEKLTEEGKEFDFIFITGDIALRGKREEYRVADIFIEELLKITKVPRNRLYLTPGNHDVDRNKIKNFHIERVYPFKTQEEITELLSDPESLQIFTRKLADFNDFAEKTMGRRHYNETTYHLVESVEMEKGGHNFRVNLMGLNSCLFAGFDGDDNRKLALGLFQTDRALNQLDEKAMFSICFFHHPFFCFHESDKISQNRLTQKIDLILTGHLHKPLGEAFRSTAGEAVIIGAGAAYETRESKNSFNIVEIDLTNGEGIASFFKYLSDHDLWKKDTDVNPLHEEGCFPFSLSSIQKNSLPARITAPPEKENDTENHKEILVKIEPETPTRPSIHFIHDYLLPDKDKFIGRDYEIKRLTELAKGKPDIETNKSASLIVALGMGGIGKSCMIRKVVHDFRQSRFRHIIWFSFYEARTEDEAYLFRAILEELGLQTETPSGESGSIKTHHLRQKLCRYLDRTPCLLVLDGLEVIQHTEDRKDHRYGKIKAASGETGKLLAHLCNQACSTAIVTSRISLSEYSGIYGYLEIPLDFFTKDAGAKFLKQLGVKGNEEELLNCASILGGHPLCLKAAGIYMACNNFMAKDVGKIIEDPVLFKKSAEAERVSEIINVYRKSLTSEQEYFLKMLSIHPRAITEKNFSVLIRDYDDKKRDATLEKILRPLLKQGLIEELKDAKGDVSYSAHPLMKLAFSMWLNKGEEELAHENWAKATAAGPYTKGSASHATSLEELQPWLDIAEHYMNANNFKEAWQVYRSMGVDSILLNLGYSHYLLMFGRRFEKEIERKDLTLKSEDIAYLYHYLGQAYSSLRQDEKSIICARKAFYAAKKTGDYSEIIVHGSAFASFCFVTGQLDEAVKALSWLEGIVKKEKTGDVFNVWQTTIAELESYKGNYLKAIDLFPSSDSYLSKYNSIYNNIKLSEALLRAGQLSKAETLLRSILKESEDCHIHMLKPVILEVCIFLRLKQDKVSEAREFNDQYMALQKSLDLPHEDEGFLLVRERKNDQALREAMPHISDDIEKKFDKVSEIENLLVSAQAWHGKGDLNLAKEFLGRATKLMEKSGCWREKDRWQETMELLNLKEGSMKLPVGLSEFERIISRDYFYVDKTLLLKEIWESSANVLLIPRPRRFGKTLNLNMMQCFFEKTLKSREPLFQKLDIAKWDKYKELLGKFPVISLTFKDARGENWQKCLEKIKRTISSEYERHSDILEILSEWELEKYENIIKLKADVADYEDSIKNLSEYLFRYYRQKVILLVDEYDMPLQALFKYPEEFGSAVDFFRNLLSGALKGNKYLAKGILTGILRTAKESVFSGLNNVAVFSILDNRFADKFGFTGKEVNSALSESGLSGSMNDVESYYNGYSIGNKKIYNPWSVINYLNRKELKPYWIKTSDNVLIHELIVQNKDTVRENVISLLNDKSIQVKLDDNIVFSEIYKKEENVWNFLVFTGYLTFKKAGKEDDSSLYNLTIPNKEVKSFFRETIQEWLEETKIGAQTRTLQEALVKGDMPVFEKELQDIAEKIFSMFDTGAQPEIFYHAFMLGLLVNMQNQYEIDSNRESGQGRYDIMLTPRHDGPGIVLEFKRAKKEEEMGKEMLKALEQIKTKKYRAKLEHRGVKKILEVGVVFCGKTVRVKKI